MEETIKNINAKLKNGMTIKDLPIAKINARMRTLNRKFEINLDLRDKRVWKELYKIEKKLKKRRKKHG